MRVRGAYMTLKEFLFTYKKGAVYTEKGNGAQDNWQLDSNRELIIPDYQREYRWGEKQLIELMEDISKDQCYLGQIAISQNLSEPRKYHIIDGQQRITSIIILYTMLVRQLALHKDSLYVQQYDLHNSVNNKENTALPRLRFSTNCFNDFQLFISQVYYLEETNLSARSFTPPKVDDYGQQSRYIDACITTNTNIKRRMSIEGEIPTQLKFIRDFLDKVLKTKISLVVFESDEVYESERVFLDINEKGLRLDNEDILKAYYFQLTPEQCGPEALETWKYLKASYCDLQMCIGKKIPLETFVNIALQTELLMHNPSLEYSKFDSKLRYKEQSGKKHICELFIPSDLHEAMKKIVMLFNDIYQLSQNDSNSEFYKRFFPGRDSTTRSIFKLLYNPIIKSGMTVVYIALIKFWWLKKRDNKNLTVDDIIQVFSFFVISNVSGLKKERILFDTKFLTSTNDSDAYRLLHLVEAEMLSNAASNSSTLILDQEKGEYLSFNIQMFYNDFVFDTNKWIIKLKNQEFLEKYDSNREKYIKDHFIIQNASIIDLYNGQSFKVTQRLKRLRKRAYNYIYHYDNLGNVDFISRIDRIHNDPTKHYGEYESAYFKYIFQQLINFFKIDNKLSKEESWKEICKAYESSVPNQFDPLVSFILETEIFSWNQSICNYFFDQFPSTIKESVNK